MPGSGSWNALAGADSSPLILCVGFPVARHREPGFTELAKKISLKYRFMQARLPAARLSQRVSASAYVNQWIDGLRDRPIAAVLGYRVGSAYAAAIAEALSRRQHTPRAILLDPQPANTWFLGHELHMEISSISSLLSDDEIESARKLTTEIAESESDVASAATTTAEIYWEISSAAFDRAGIGGSYCSKSFAPFESYISLISAASQIDPSSVWKCSTALLSSDYVADLPDRTFLTDESSIQFDVPHTGLLRSDSVAETILNLLELH
jgi:hypothetical protein